MTDTLEAVARLAVGAGLSGLIGFERQVAQKAAGVRTHMLVGLGSALFTLIGAEAFSGADPARLAAGVVSGIGFLGAGAIIRHGVSVRGLTTAAGLWTAAAVGLASGIGEMLLATAATATALIVLYVVGLADRFGLAVGGPAIMELSVVDPSQVEGVSEQARVVVGRGGRVAVLEAGKEGNRVRVTVEQSRADAVLMRLLELDGVERVRLLRP